jgi:hypothetical protein
MKSKFLMIALLATAFSAAPAWAAWNGAALKTDATPATSNSSKASNWNITMKILESTGGDAGPVRVGRETPITVQPGTASVTRTLEMSAALRAMVR